MTLRRSTALAATLTLALLTGAPSVPANAQTMEGTLADMNSRLKSVRMEMDLAQKHVATTQERYRAGLAAQSDVDQAQTRLAQLSGSVMSLQRERDELAARQALLRPTNVRLDHASLRQAATALSRASGVSIAVDASVSQQTAVTLDAHDVPLAGVLEAMAQKADLMIAPTASGVAIKNWPRLNDRIYRSPSAPWSDEWGVPPTMVASLRGLAERNPGMNRPIGVPPAGPGIGGDDGPASLAVPGAPAPQPFQTPQGGFAPGGAVPQPFQMPQGDFPGGPAGNNPFGMGGGPRIDGIYSVTTLGDRMIAITEPGFNENGQPGLRITAYMFDGTGFHRMGASGFHLFQRVAGPGRPGEQFRQAPGGGPAPRFPGGGAPATPSRGSDHAPSGIAPATTTVPAPGGLRGSDSPGSADALPATTTPAGPPPPAADTAPPARTAPADSLPATPEPAPPATTAPAGSPPAAPESAPAAGPATAPPPAPVPSAPPPAAPAPPTIPAGSAPPAPPAPVPQTPAPPAIPAGGTPTAPPAPKAPAPQ